MIRGISDSQFLSKLYGGWLGKAIGVKTGMYVENWTSEAVLRSFGRVKGPITRYAKRFAADDDTNGPGFYPMALDLFGAGLGTTPAQMAETVLNFCGDHHGFFYWGGGGNGNGYDRFKYGIMPPEGVTPSKRDDTLAGLIFTDGWGYILPCAPELAAEMARRQNSTYVTGNALHAGGFLCACIAEAYRQDDIEKIIEAALGQLPECKFKEMVEGILAIYRSDKCPDKWQGAFSWMMGEYVTEQKNEPYNLYANGACILIALLYGRESFEEVMNIGTMCAWDCDCNLSNAGAIMGVLAGAEGIEDGAYRKPVNDFMCLSSTMGSMNNNDIPSIVAWYARKAYELAGEAPDGPEYGWVFEDGRRYHFELPGSTHTIVAEQHETGRPDYVVVENTGEQAHSGSRSLRIAVPRAQPRRPIRAYTVTYPRLEDFDVFGYQPDFCPILYPGQSVSMYIKPRGDINEGASARVYAELRDGDVLYGEPAGLEPGGWRKICLDIPQLADATIVRAGVEVVTAYDPLALGVIPGWGQPLVFYIDDFAIEGAANYETTFKNAVLEKQTWGPRNVPSECSYTRGDWYLAGGKLLATYIGDLDAECYTGDYLWRDYWFEADVEPLLGYSHGICARVRGGRKSVGLRLAGGGALQLHINDCGYRPLSSVDIGWGHGKKYRMALRVEGSKIEGWLDGEKLLEAVVDDPALQMGCVGFVNGYKSHTRFHRYAARPLKT